MTDDECATELAIAEEDLIDDYTTGRLRGKEARAFDAMFLTTPQRFEAVRFSKLLNDYLNIHRAAREASLAPAPHYRAWQRLALVSCCLGLIFAATTAWYFARARKLSAELQMARIAAQKPGKATPAAAAGANPHEQTRSSATSNQQVTENPSRTEVSLFLKPGLTRGTEQTLPTAQFGLDTKTLLLEMNIPDDHYAAFRAEVQNANGRKVWVGRPTAVQHINSQLLIKLRIKSAPLTSGEYIAEISATHAKAGSAADEVNSGLANYEEVGSFVFVVRR